MYAAALPLYCFIVITSLISWYWWLRRHCRHSLATFATPPLMPPSLITDAFAAIIIISHWYADYAIGIDTIRIFWPHCFSHDIAQLAFISMADWYWLRLLLIRHCHWLRYWCCRHYDAGLRCHTHISSWLVIAIFTIAKADYRLTPAPALCLRWHYLRQ